MRGEEDYYHTDHLGSTRLVTDEAGNVVTDIQYKPFGEPIGGEERFLYTGKERDSTGLYYYGARYYDPEIGRFITRDPLAGKKVIPQSLNRYVYCFNNPLKFHDPSGLWAMCDEKDVCIRFIDDGWTAYDANGNKITDSEEMAKLLDPTGKDEKKRIEDQAKAAYLMLLITHPEIQGDPGQEGKLLAEGGYIFWVDIEGERVPIWIWISKLFESDKGDLAYSSLTKWEIEKGVFIDIIKLIVYQGAFQSVAHLFHVMGHEGVHIYELVTLGETSEKNSYRWNLDHLFSPFAYPWDIGVLILLYRHGINPLHPPFGSAIPV